MAVALQGETKVWHRRERGEQFAVWAAWLVGAAVFAWCWQLISDKTIWAFVLDAPEQAADLAPGAVAVGTDGCGVPGFGMDVRAMALM